jgi:LPXTG-motif cell wall-anchored protein
MMTVSPGRSFERAVRSEARRLHPTLRGSRWARWTVRALIVVTAVAVAVLAWATIAKAGKITPTGNCTVAPAVSWAVDGTDTDFEVRITGPAGTVSGLAASGTMPAQWGQTYVAVWYKGGVPWGSATTTLPSAPVCDTTPATTVAPAPTLAPVIDLTGDTVPGATDGSACDQETQEGNPNACLGLDLATATTAPTGIVTATTLPSSLDGGAQLPATGRNTDLLLLAGVLVAALGVTCLIVRGHKRPSPQADIAG